MDEALLVVWTLRIKSDWSRGLIGQIAEAFRRPEIARPTAPGVLA